MNYGKIVLQILKTIRNDEKFDINHILNVGSEHSISDLELGRMINELKEHGLIDGLSASIGIDDLVTFNIFGPTVTLKGNQYIQENS